MSRPVPDGLVEAFWAYERALGENDVEALDRLFAPGAGTLRGDAEGLLVGHDAIAAFRRTRAGAPARRIVQTHVQPVDDDHALVVAVTELAGGGRGQQTQLWRRLPSGWAVTAAHVSVPPPALDSRVWRAVGDPLVPPTDTTATGGPLAGETVAVKDLYAVAGHRVGAGNPVWLADAAVETQDAAAVAALLDAGAAVRGISRTDELAYSLAGTNPHTGTPPNPRAPGRVPGGSSSGSASAVSLGQTSIGLGTDTGGSIRVPAAYQGLWGLRTTHGAVSRAGLLPLAPSFDTVGWLTRDADLLARVGEVLLPADRRPLLGGDPELTPDDLVLVTELLAMADDDVADAVTRSVRGWLPSGGREEKWPDDDTHDLAAWQRAFVVQQAAEAWASHGRWLSAAPDRLASLGADVRTRFERGRDLTGVEADQAARTVHEARSRIVELVGDGVLVLPAAPTVAPPLGEGLEARLQAAREATLSLTCLAGLGGLPALVVPVATADGLPAGVCLLAAPGRDRALLRLGRVLAGL